MRPIAGTMSLDRVEEYPRLARKMSKPRVRRLKPRRIPGPSTIVDRDELWRFLWERSDHNHLVRVHMTKLADLLGISPRMVSKIMATFCEDGQALRVRFDKDGVGIFQIADPALWRPQVEQTWANGRKEIRWG